MAFSSYPTSPGLLFEIKQWPWKVGLNYTRLGGKRWTQVDFNGSLSHQFRFFDNSLVFYRGAFYCLGQDGNLLEFRNNGVTC